MKKINSIGYGHKIIGVASVFLVVIPTASHLISTFTNKVAFLFLSRISFILGSFILLFLFVLLTIYKRYNKSEPKMKRTLGKK